MAQRKNFQESFQFRDQRNFSEEFKKSKVKEIQKGISKISEIAREYEVSRTSVYNWLKQFTNVKKGTKTIVETESDTRKLQKLKNEIAELERKLGQKQVELDFNSKMIELAEEEYQIDIKKKFGGKQSSGSGKTGKQ